MDSKFCSGFHHLKAVMYGASNARMFVDGLTFGLIIVPPLVATRIFAPCFDCFDFEAAALHEIGHFIGLGHPDNIPQNWQTKSWARVRGPGNNSYHSLIAREKISNRRLSAGMNSFVCMNPWANVTAGVPPGATLDDRPGLPYPSRNAQMEARTQHNPLTCLMDDDLEALAVLYPDCGEYSLTGAVCHKVSTNIGFVR